MEHRKHSRRTVLSLKGIVPSEWEQDHYSRFFSGRILDFHILEKGGTSVKMDYSGMKLEGTALELADFILKHKRNERELAMERMKRPQDWFTHTYTGTNVPPWGSTTMY